MFSHPELIFLQATERRLAAARPALRRPVPHRVRSTRQRSQPNPDQVRAGPAARPLAGTLAACVASGGAAQ